MGTPKVSVITVVYNAKYDLVQTMNSIRILKDFDMEYIIVDGGSTDGTLQVIKRNNDIVDQFITEQDEGIFDAMNKGIKKASGQWLLFLNAGDQVFANALELIDFERNKDCAVIFGNTKRSSGEVSIPFKLELLEVGVLPACHQSMLFNRVLLKDELYYDTTFKLFGENELMMRLYAKGYGMKYENVTVSYFKGGGISDQISHTVRLAKFYFLFRYFGIIGVLNAIRYRFKLLTFDSI